MRIAQFPPNWTSKPRGFAVIPNFADDGSARPGRLYRRREDNNAAYLPLSNQKSAHGVPQLITRSEARNSKARRLPIQLSDRAYSNIPRCLSGIPNTPRVRRAVILGRLTQSRGACDPIEERGRFPHCPRFSQKTDDRGIRGDLYSTNGSAPGSKAAAQVANAGPRTADAPRPNYWGKPHLPTKKRGR